MTLGEHSHTVDFNETQNHGIYGVESSKRTAHSKEGKACFPKVEIKPTSGITHTARRLYNEYK
jgi:hypothetical protein